jgi:hypothetical protein
MLYVKLVLATYRLAMPDYSGHYQNIYGCFAAVVSAVFGSPDLSRSGASGLLCTNTVHNLIMRDCPQVAAWFISLGGRPWACARRNYSSGRVLTVCLLPYTLPLDRPGLAFRLILIVGWV